MDYREILREQLRRRQELNPRFSLRSFALKLEISPSKLSEVFSGKKNLSQARLEEIARRLNLRGPKKEIFLLSAELESVKFRNREDLKLKLKKLAQDIGAEQTTQRNAWYFGAVKTLTESGLDPTAYQKQMNLTSLQIENAIRFLKRIKRFHPGRDDLAFEPMSLFKRISESFEDSTGHLRADFAFLTPEQIDELSLKIRSLFKKFKADRKSTNLDHLQMVYFGVSGILKEEK